MPASHPITDVASSRTASGCDQGSSGSTVAQSSAKAASTCRMLAWSSGENQLGSSPTKIPSWST